MPILFLFAFGVHPKCFQVPPQGTCLCLFVSYCQSKDGQCELLLNHEYKVIIYSVNRIWSARQRRNTEARSRIVLLRESVNNNHCNMKITIYSIICVIFSPFVLKALCAASWKLSHVHRLESKWPEVDFRVSHKHADSALRVETSLSGAFCLVQPERAGE